MFNSHYNYTPSETLLLSSLPDLNTNLPYHSQFSFFSTKIEADFTNFNVKREEADDNSEYSAQTGSTSASQSPLRQPNSPQKSYNLGSLQLKQEESQGTVFKLARMDSLFSSEDDSQYDEQTDLQSPPNKRKSNICLSRENIMKTWTKQDDSVLLKLADQYKNDWKKIAKRIITNNKKKVTPNFLKNRYKEIAGDHIKKGVKFTHEEDLKIAQLFNDYGTAWTKIALHFPDRTPVMIKNRYYSHIRRKGLLTDLVCEATGNEDDVDCEDIIEEKEEEEETPQYQKTEVTSTQPSVQSQNNDDDYGEWFSNREFRLFDQFETYFELNGFLPEEELHSRITPFKTQNNFSFF